MLLFRVDHKLGVKVHAHLFVDGQRISSPPVVCHQKKLQVCYEEKWEDVHNSKCLSTLCSQWLDVTLTESIMEMQLQLFDLLLCILKVGKNNGLLLFQEPNNLRGVNSFRYNGLVQEKTVGVEATSDGKGVVLVTRNSKRVS